MHANHILSLCIGRDSVLDLGVVVGWGVVPGWILIFAAIVTVQSSITTAIAFQTDLARVTTVKDADVFRGTCRRRGTIADLLK